MITGQAVAMRVQRADGTLEFDAGTDAYAVLVEETRSRIKSLAKLDNGRLHSRHVVALLTSCPDPRRDGLKTTSTVVAPTDPVLGGAVLFAGLVSMQKHNPAVFAEAMRRLRDAGLIGGL